MERHIIDPLTLPEKVELVGIGMTRQVFLDEEYLDPAPSIEINNHCPDGFNWGYLGSGPAQLSLAICVRYLGREEAEKTYQVFKRQVVAHFGLDNVRVNIMFRAWYEQLTPSQVPEPMSETDPSKFVEVLPFEVEDSGLTVMDSLTFIPKPDERRGSENPLL